MSTNGNGHGNGKSSSHLNLVSAQPINRVIDRLQRFGYMPEPCGNGTWRSRCPAHEGDSKNLSVKEAEDGKILLNCHHRRDGTLTCTAAQIVEALGLELKDLFAGDTPQRGKPRKSGAKPTPKASVPAVVEPRAPLQPVNRIRAFPSARAAIAVIARKLGEPTRESIYRDGDGSELMRVCRFDLADGSKEFRPFHVDADGWRIGDPPGLLPVYRLNEITTATRIVVVTEGEKCADLVAAIGLEATTSAHGAEAPAKTDWTPLAAKEVVILPDNDDSGRGYAEEVAGLLGRLRPRPMIRVVDLPVALKKDDVEQWLEQLPPHWGPAERRAELLRLAALAPPWQPPPQSPPAIDDRYGNFSALITREVIRHEGVRSRRQIEIETYHADGTVARVVIPSLDFESLDWVISEFGMRYHLKQARGAKDRFIEMVREESLSRGFPVTHVHTELGWHEIEGQSVYLHAGGGIGARGPVHVEIDTRPELQRLELPKPDPAMLPDAMRRILAIPDRLGEKAASISATILAIAARAILGASRMTPHMVGTTGTYKTTTACLAQRFYAPGIRYDDPMPLSWASTAAGQEIPLYLAKDTLVVVDNFIADGENSSREMHKINAVLNSIGDRRGKGRMDQNGQMMACYDPRGTVVSTGEVEPDRRSALGRALILEFRPDLIPLDGLKACHDDAEGGWYAQAIACYAMHLAGVGIDTQRDELRRLTEELGPSAREHCPGAHARQVEGICEMVAAWALFLRFAAGSRAVTSEQATTAMARVRTALFDTLPIQAEIQEEADPGEVFLDLLGSVLTSKRAALVGVDGNVPDTSIAAACGWEQIDVAIGHDTVRDWTVLPAAERIGWVAEDRVYLDFTLAYKVVKRLSGDAGGSLGSRRQVQARLAETGKIDVEGSGEDGGRRYFTVKRMVQGTYKRVLSLDRSQLFEVAANLPDRSDSPDPDGTTDAHKVPPF